MAGKKWTAEEEQRLQELYDRGYSWAAMQLMFANGGFIRGAEGLRKKAASLGLPPRRRTDIIFDVDSIGGIVNQEDDIEENLWKEQKRLVLRENSALKKRVRKLLAGNEIFLEAARSAVARLPSVAVPEPHFGGEHTPEVAMLDISDVHGGELVTPDDILGLGGGYNFERCREMMNTLARSVLSITDIQRKGGVPINHLVINLLGDIVTNEDIFIGQGRQIDLILVDQIFALAQELGRRVILPMCQNFEHVTAYAVWGNHGRLGHKGTKHQRTNADYILYKVMAMMLKAQPNFTMYTSQSPVLGYRLEEDPSRSHLLAHGDQVRRWMSIPFYGLERWSRRMVSLTQIIWSYVHIGHHHSTASLDCPHGEQLINGCWPGGSSYSVNQLQVASQPKQSFRGFSPTWGKTWSYDIILGSRPRLEFDNRGIATPICDGEVACIPR